MLKAELRLPLSDLHCRLARYLGVAITQIAPNAWWIFLGAEVLYKVLKKGRRRLTLEEFFHCYRPLEITKSRRTYNFLARKPSLRLVCDTPNSNRDWKNRYFFVQREKWINHSNERQNMPFYDKTWGIMPKSGMSLSM